MQHLEVIQKKIYEVRGQRVMLDLNLAQLYEVETRVLNQATKRSIDSSPEDFMFRLTKKEWQDMSSQIVMTSISKRPKTAILLEFGIISGAASTIPGCQERIL